MIKLMDVPKSIFMQVNPATEVQELMGEFFRNTKDYILSKSKGVYNLDFEVKSASFNYSDKTYSDDRITYVSFKEKYVVAGMLETRTAFNDLQFTFFRDLSFLNE